MWCQHPIHDGVSQRLPHCQVARRETRDKTSANIFATDGIQWDDICRPKSSSTTFNRRSSLIIGRLYATNVLMTWTTLVLSIRSFKAVIPSRFTCCPSWPERNIRMALNSRTEMHSARSLHHHIP
jgi:hypothetical protein